MLRSFTSSTSRVPRSGVGALADPGRVVCSRACPEHMELINGVVKDRVAGAHRLTTPCLCLAADLAAQPLRHGVVPDSGLSAACKVQVLERKERDRRESGGEASLPRLAGARSSQWQVRGSEAAIARRGLLFYAPTFFAQVRAAIVAQEDPWRAREDETGCISSNPFRSAQ
jgi:hypothetical protein